MLYHNNSSVQFNTKTGASKRTFSLYCTCSRCVLIFVLNWLIFTFRSTVHKVLGLPIQVMAVTNAQWAEMLLWVLCIIILYHCFPMIYGHVSLVVFMLAIIWICNSYEIVQYSLQVYLNLTNKFHYAFPINHWFLNLSNAKNILFEKFKTKF